MTRFIVLVTMGLLSLMLATVAFAGTYTLHPSGFGEKSYAAWKAQEGLRDSRGNDFQALYLQKQTLTATQAAGVAVIKGLEGIRADQITGLSWDHRTDGHCGAGAPRWNIAVTNTTTGQDSVVFLGCIAAAHSPVAQSDPGGHNSCTDSYGQAAISQQFMGQTGAGPSSFTVRGLAIVFDEGTDNPPLPLVPGCPAGSGSPGFVYLDNITVAASGQTHVWTGASDNGNNNQTITQDPATPEFLQSMGWTLPMILR